MNGFFTKKETNSITRPDGKTYSCFSCGLYRTCKSKRMQPYGNFGKNIMVVGEAPGEVEDERGKPFQGKTGRLLKNTLEKIGIDLFEDCIVLNAVNCRPSDENGNNRTPTNYEIECCRAVKVLKEIEQYSPTVVILLGKSALYSVIGNRWKKSLDGISKWRGWCIPDQDLGCWIVPTFHPSYVERSEDMPVVKRIWEQDLQLALDKTTVTKVKRAKIKVIEDLSVFDKINDGQVIAFDYETTGLKPHARKHKIICASVAVSKELCYVFMMPEERDKLKPFLRILELPRIEKVAQNMKFEHAWTWNKLRTNVQGWRFDTMLASHVLDNRPFITGLKFQVYVNFGVIDYSSEIEPYLRSMDEKNANSINRIEQLIKTESGREKLLNYCGWDSIYEYRLAEQQQEVIQYDLPF